jgi:hypothetical protein
MHHREHRGHRAGLERRKLGSCVVRNPFLPASVFSVLSVVIKS